MGVVVVEAKEAGKRSLKFLRSYAILRTWNRITQALQIRPDEVGMVDWDMWCVDGTNVRATQAAAGAVKKGDRKNLPTTLYVARATDVRANGTWSLTVEGLLTVHATAGQVHDSTQAAPVPRGRSGVPIGPEQVAGDKGYSAGRIRGWMKQRAIEGVIPHRDDERRRDPQGTLRFDKTEAMPGRGDAARKWR